MINFKPLHVVYPEEYGGINEEKDDESDLGSPLGSDVVLIW